jgi:hypothetical protein
VDNWRCRGVFSHITEGARRLEEEAFAPYLVHVLRLSFDEHCCKRVCVYLLSELSRTADIWLTCTVSEKMLTRNWSKYGFHEGRFQMWRRVILLFAIAVHIIFLSHHKVILRREFVAPDRHCTARAPPARAHGGNGLGV